MAAISNVLFSEVIKFDAEDPNWFNRDRFVLSNGHASALIYSMLHLCGYRLSMDDLKAFRQLHSNTPGHPERGVTEGVEVTTGPLGQGLANAVGMALVEAQMAATYNKDDLKVVDHHTYVFCGDGCLMEGVALEALSLAGHLALNKLVVIYDDNKITIDGSTSVAFTENTAVKYAAMGFNIITVEGGNHDYDAMRKAISDAKASTDKPTLILLKTVIGFGSKMEGTAKVHGSPLGADDIIALKTASGRDPTKTFHVTDEEYAHFRAASIKGAAANKEWNATLEKYTAAYGPELAARIAGTLPEGWKAKLPLNGKSIATRKASENTLAEIIPAIPAMLGGSADLTGSNLTRPGEAALVDFQKESPAGRYIRFGVREHGMCGIMNGMHAHGGSIPFGGTFLNFIGYALG
jgi:transketolase